MKWRTFDSAPNLWPLTLSRRLLLLPLFLHRAIAKANIAVLVMGIQSLCWFLCIHTNIRKLYMHTCMHHIHMHPYMQRIHTHIYIHAHINTYTMYRLITNQLEYSVLIPTNWPGESILSYNLVTSVNERILYPIRLSNRYELKYSTLRSS